jgi:LPXTG-motif cell wall-anchored protein
MRQLTPFVAVYAVAAVLIVPGSLLAAEGDGTTQQEASGRTTATDLPAPAQAPGAQPAPAGAPAPAEPVAPPAAPPAAPVPAAPPAAAIGAAGSEAPVAEAPAEEAQDERQPNVLAGAAAGVSVTIRDFDYTPKTVTVGVGDTVTWNNSGPTFHTATANDGSFDTGNLKRGQSGSHTFTEAGTFAYICTPHPFMKGTVVVRAANAGQGGGDDPVSSDDPGSGAGSGSGSGASGSAGGAGGSGAGAGAAEGAAAGGESGSRSGAGSGGSLPATGADAAALAILGALLLVLGAATRRRSAAAAAGPAGRIGW